MLRVRQPFRARYRSLKRQQGWLRDLERCFDPAPFGWQQARASEVKRQVKALLSQVQAAGEQSRDGQERAAAQHFCATVRRRWRGLFTCYRVRGLPRTNNDLEGFLCRLKTGQRRITGRKSVHGFLLRYGRYAAFIDYRETYADLYARLRQVDQTAFVKERAVLAETEEQLQKLHRFRHRPKVFLKELEQRWALAVRQTAPSKRRRRLVC